MNQTGIVKKVKGNMATVSFVRSEACASCRACSFGQKEELEVDILNSLDAKTGDLVDVQLHSEKIVKASAILYMFPALAFVLGLWIAPKIHSALSLTIGSDGFSMLLAIILMGIALIIIKLTDKKRIDTGEFTPVMLEIVASTQKDQ
ncbi:MAG: SoxR reducing system RseC family protein [Clostridia bacterium]|nr:SoxR reducing system RseC family protein [Clostridia bacterium]